MVSFGHVLEENVEIVSLSSQLMLLPKQDEIRSIVMFMTLRCFVREKQNFETDELTKDDPVSL